MRRASRHRSALAATRLLRSLLPAVAPVRAADPLVLRTGTTQDLQVLNPWNAVVVADFEVFTAQLRPPRRVRPNIEPVPGFAESWTQSTDGKTWTFKIRAGMKWSDGQPATSEDARWTFQLVLDAGTTPPTAIPRPGLPRAVPDERRRDEGRGARPEDLVVTTDFPTRPPPPGLRPDPAEARLVEVHDGRPRRDDHFKNEPRSSGPARTRRSNGSPVSSSGSPATPTTGASRARRTR